MSLVERLESELPDLPYPEDPAELERAKVERMVNDGVALVAEEDGKAVGYVLARYGDHGPTTVYVSDLWVDSTLRGGGIGRELLRRVSEGAIAHGSTHVVLDVDSTNRDAIAFYQRLGFEEVGRLPIRDEAINVFMNLPGDGDMPKLELTYNHGVDSYEIGTGYGHIALSVDDLDATLERLKEQGIEPEKPPYSVREGGSRLCFVRDPDDYRIELIEKG
jgi:lactoylglutathione lyase